jgi:hypothetical protein
VERGWRRGVWGAKPDFRTMGRKKKRAKNGEEEESLFFRILFFVKRKI